MAPVSTTGIVMGKLLAALLVYLAAMAVTLVEAFVLSRFATVEWSVILGHFIGLFLLGAALIAVGLLISALTENQIIAAIGGFCVGFFLMLLDSLAGLIKNTVLAGFVTDLSFQTHYQNFTLGMFSPVSYTHLARPNRGRGRWISKKYSPSSSYGSFWPRSSPPRPPVWGRRPRCSAR